MLEIKELTKKYNNHTVLKDLNYSFEKGKIYFILGESGCGKTTLLKIIGGLDKDYQGHVIYKNHDIKKFDKDEKKNYLTSSCSLIEQAPRLFDKLKGETNLRFVEKNNKIARKNRYSFLAKLKLSKKASKYSSGEKQRIEIARALNQNSQIILADEPTASLDKKNRKIVLETLVKEKSEKIIIVVSHDKELAYKYGDEILILERGKLKQKVKKTKSEGRLEKDNKKLKLYDSFLIANEYQKSERKDNFIYVMSLYKFNIYKYSFKIVSKLF